MSRRWLTVLLFVLAMTVQVFAPVANGVAAAHGLDDALCLTSAQADHAAPGQPLHSHHSHHHDCVLCQVFCDGAAPVAGRSAALVAPNAQWSLLQWTPADQRAVATLRATAHRARAPPVVA